MKRGLTNHSRLVVLGDEDAQLRQLRLLALDGLLRRGSIGDGRDEDVKRAALSRFAVDEDMSLVRSAS